MKFLFIVPLKNQRCLSTQVNSKRNSFAIFFYLSYIFTTIFYNSQIVESFNRFKLYPYNKKPSDLKKVRPLLRRAIKACRQEGGMPPLVEIEMPLRQGNQKLWPVINPILIWNFFLETVLVSKHCSIIKQHAKFEPDRTNRTGVMTKIIRALEERKNFFTHFWLN